MITRAKPTVREEGLEKENQALRAELAEVARRGVITAPTTSDCSAQLMAKKRTRLHENVEDFASHDAKDDSDTITEAKEYLLRHGVTGTDKRQRTQAEHMNICSFSDNDDEDAGDDEDDESEADDEDDRDDENESEAEDEDDRDGEWKPRSKWTVSQD